MQSAIERYLKRKLSTAGHRAMSCSRGSFTTQKEITRMISDQIALHSVQLPLLIH